MRKTLGSIIAVCIIIIIGAVYAAPSYISSQITAKVQQKIHSDSVATNIETSPNFMLLFGKIDNLNLTADNIQLDKINLNRLTINGTDIDLNMQELLLARRLIINSAQNFTIEGIIDEANLAKLLNDKIDKVSDITVSISPDSIDATGKISLLGRESTVHVKGHVLLQDNNLIFRITNIDTANSFLGRIGINFTKDIVISNTASLPVENVQFTRAEQQNGQVLIAAGMNK